MKKLFFLLLVVMSIALLVGCTTGKAGTGTTVKIFKSPTCGCCVGHAAALKSEGYTVETVEMQDLTSIKTQYNIPPNMQSCHTEVIGKYFVEGHVPMEAIEKLLAEQPDIDGIALPGMPSGSPGMPGPKRGSWQIYALKDGQATPFMTI